MSVFDKLRSEIDRAEEGETSYLSSSFDERDATNLNFWRVSDITFHDAHALIEYRNGGSVKFYHAADLHNISVHFVPGSIIDYFRAELTGFWDALNQFGT